MDTHLFEQLYTEEIISKGELQAIREKEETRLISVHWDLRVLLYFGVLLLGAGLSVILYKNIDTIGHSVLVTLTGLLAAACFFYCFRVSAPFSSGRVQSPNVWFDYILLLGCLAMLGFVGYLQFQYHVFGARWGMATFIPMLLLFAFAYYFDHMGVLSMAITNLGAWMGIALTPMQLVRMSTFTGNDLVINGVLLGILLHMLCSFSLRRDVKYHFGIIYRNFGAHVLFISLIAAMFSFWDWRYAWFVALLVLVVYYVRWSLVVRSFYFLVAALLYGFIGLSIIVIDLLLKAHGSMKVEYLVILYVIGACIGLVKLLMYYNGQLKKQ